MQTPDDPLASLHSGLSELLRPYRSEWKRRERLSKFLEQCIRAAKKDDFFQLSALLTEKRAADIEADPAFAGIAPLFHELRTHSEQRIDAYRTDFIGDLLALAQEANIPLTIDFPRFSSKPGIAGEFGFADRITTLSGKKLKFIAPKRIITALQRLDRRLYGRTFQPQAFIDGLFSTYNTMLEEGGNAVGESLPIRAVYLRHVLTMQSAAFFQDMEKRRFRGYPLDEFSVDLWRFYQSNISHTTQGRVLRLRPGRGQSLWLLDSTGEKRQIANIAFLEADE